MKVYVDELPESCDECPCCDGNHVQEGWYMYCNILKQGLIKRGKRMLKDCKLQLISNHDEEVRAEERKKTCKEVREHLESMLLGYKWEDKILVGKFCNIANAVLDQIEGENK